MDLFTEALQFLQDKDITKRTFSLGDVAHLMAGFAKSKLEEKNISIPPAEGAEKTAMGIVNQLFDLAEVPIEKRQDINDTADKYLTQRLTEFATLHAQRIAEKMVSERLREDTYMTCDVCGCHPSVIITTSFGKFCQQHAKYI